MCGLVGASWRHDGDSLRSKFAASLSLLAHRGPNDSGVEYFQVQSGAMLALGHTRLSIIDLSNAGHQPMFSKDKRYALVFNGEIYNYKELRKELEAQGHSFFSDSDSEVLLIAWIHWGKACLKRLVGMFAFVIYDKTEESLVCVRDAFGIKPFFYTLSEDGTFIYASELPALLKLRDSKPQLNWQRAYDYLVYGDYDEVEDSFVEGVKHLKPGHLLKFNLKSSKIENEEQWWSPSITPVSTLSFSDAAEHLRELFLNNVKLHLRSDVPLGAALSGGIDSSAVVCAMRLVEPSSPIHTFSFIAQGSQVSEEKWVDIVNNKVSATPHKVVVSAQELAQDLGDMIRAQGEPFGSTSIYAQYRVFKLAKEKGITVTLDGQGADEILGGYVGFPGRRMMSLFEEGKVLKLIEFTKNWAEWPNRSSKMAWMMFASQLLPQNVHGFFRRLVGKDSDAKWLRKDVLEEQGVKLGLKQHIPLNSRGRSLAAQLAASLQHRNLPALLRHADRNAMRFSIESRVPFLTTDIADFTLSLPEEYLVSHSGETKSIFRAAMRGIVPDEILDRRDKIGFETPEKEWFMSMRDTLRAWISEDVSLPFLDQKEILAEFDFIMSGKKPFSWQIWRWVNFIQWYKIFILGK